MNRDLSASSFPIDLSELGDSEIAVGGKISLEEIMKQLWTEMINRLKSGDSTAWIVTTVTVGVTSMIIAYLISPSSSSDRSNNTSINTKEKEEEPIVLRDFTMDQLRAFNGEGETKIYISLKGDVYDVTSASHMYGPDGSYHCFAGREASRAMAKLSFEENELANGNYSDLSPFEKSTLNDWIEKFKYLKCYPIVGRVSVPPSGLRLPPSALRCPAADSPPPGRVHAPIYIALKGDVFDVSFGGREMYGEGGPYAIFAGTDASRALAKMSFREEDIQSRDLADLAESELRVLDDWHRKFAETKKYPIVGKIIDDT